MGRAFLTDGGHYVAILDEGERAMLAGLMEQTRLILAPEIESTGDAFADLVASMGVSLAAEDQQPDLGEDDDDTGDVATDDEARTGEAADDDTDGLADDLTGRDPALDRLLPTGGGGRFAWPALAVSIEDGRARMETPAGVVGAALTGSGRLDRNRFGTCRPDRNRT